MMALSSCNDDALFEKEMYKNVVALISSDYYNTFEEGKQLPQYTLRRIRRRNVR